MPLAEVLTAVADAEASLSSNAIAPEAGSSNAPCSSAVSGAAPQSERFYQELAEVSDFRDVLAPDRYVQVPLSSLLVSTDVLGSMRAIEAGRYRDVNALGVASVVGLCNAVRDVEIPYMFRGRGAMAVMPGSRRRPVEQALRGLRSLALSAFGLDLRSSIIPIAELVDAGHVARLARFRSSDGTRLAMFSGSAFAVAERWCEDPERGPRYEVGTQGESLVDLEGFECRWQPLVSRRGHSVSLMIRARAATEAERSQIYRNIWHAFGRIVDGAASHPVKLDQLKLQAWFGDYSVEARIRAQALDGPVYKAAFRRARGQARMARLLSSLGVSAEGCDGKSYSSDFRRFDDTLRMVVDLSQAELYRLESRLSAEQRAGRLAYGLHCSPAALVTCFARSHGGGRVHFVDGCDGGLSLAANRLELCLGSGARREND